MYSRANHSGRPHDMLSKRTSESILPASNWSIEDLSRIQQPVRIQCLFYALHNCNSIWPNLLEQLVFLEKSNRMFTLKLSLSNICHSEAAVNLLLMFHLVPRLAISYSWHVSPLQLIQQDQICGTWWLRGNCHLLDGQQLMRIRQVLSALSLKPLSCVS